MRLRIHHRLFLGMAGVVGLLVLLLGVLVGRGLRRELTRSYQEELARQLDLGEALIDARPGASPDALARLMTRRIGYRVTLIDPEGVVRGDSYLDPAGLRGVESHADRPEVRGALAGRPSFSQRTSATVGVPLLYGARLVRHAGEPVVLRIAAPLDQVEGAVDRFQGTVLATGAAAMLGALLVAYLLSMALTRPLLVLVGHARTLAGGDFTTRVRAASGVPELDDLAQALNRLADELRVHMGELGRERDEMRALIDTMAEGVVALTGDARVFRTNQAARELLELPASPPFPPVGTVVRHPELRALLEAAVVEPGPPREVRVGDRHLLVASRLLDSGGAVATLLDVSEIRRLEQVRRDFVANASHELKTPLTTILGFTETLAEDDPPAELRLRFLELIRSNTVRLQALVDDLLDLSRLESGGWVAEPADVHVDRVAAEAWAPYADAAAGRDVEISVDADVVARADRPGLEQILRNLLENALRHSHDGGVIEVTAERRGERVVIEVSDDGEGIPSRALPRIFERFYRADSSRARDFGGTGLGLAIVRHLTESMGGSVEAESALGRGTTVRVTLPAGESAASRDVTPLLHHRRGPEGSPT